MARLKSSSHGGNVYAASRKLDRSVRTLIDFSASINPLGPSRRVWQAIVDCRQLLAHYPDPDCWELRQTLAKCWDRQPEEIAVGNGSTELIDVIPRALKIRHLLVIHPTFSEYVASMERVGGRVSAVYAKRTEQYRQPISDLCQVLDTRRPKSSAIDGVILCNPNSPTGQACTVDEVRRLADIAQRRGIWLIIDEAFADYCAERSFLPVAVAWPRVVILRSVTKFYALPGLRVGYAVAKPTVVEALRQQMPPWSVNVMGQASAIAAVNDRSYAQKSVRFMDRERERLGTMLAALPSCVVTPTYANYFFLELPHGWSAREVRATLLAEGLLIRDCSTVPGANARSIRLAVRSQRENDFLLQALSKTLLPQTP